MILKVRHSAMPLFSRGYIFKDAGAEIKEFYLTMGQYDAVVVSESPNDEATAKIALLIGSQGNIQTQTFRAFSENEFRKIVAAMP